MHDLVPVFVVATLVFGVYKMIELFVRRRERMTIIEKFSNGINVDLEKSLNLPLFSNSDPSASWPIRIGLLLVGIGLGVMVATIVDMSTEGVRNTDNAIRVLYPACAAFFGGVGLVVAYFVENNRKKPNNEQ